MSIPKNNYQIKVTLDGPRPLIWRRFLVPDTVSLYDLHTILQIVMGWTDSHLHQFIINGQNYTDLQDDDTGELDMIEENGLFLNQFKIRAGSSFNYIYDFGDGWHHTVKIEKVLPAEKGNHSPFCSAGIGACPP